MTLNINDFQHNNTLQNVTQNNGLKCDTQHNDTQNKRYVSSWGVSQFLLLCWMLLYQVPLCRVFIIIPNQASLSDMPSGITLSVVVVNVVAPSVKNFGIPTWKESFLKNEKRNYFWYFFIFILMKPWKLPFCEFTLLKEKTCFQNESKFITEDHFVKWVNITIY